MGLIPGLGRSPGEGNGNLLQYSCLGSPMDRGAWRATVHKVTKSRTQMKRLSTHTGPQMPAPTHERQQSPQDKTGFWKMTFRCIFSTLFLKLG